MAFGDSNTYRPPGSQCRWTSLLENKDPGKLQVINESYDGRTTQFDGGERNGLGVIAVKLKRHRSLRYIVIMLGTNDIKNMYGPPQTEEIIQGMSKIIDVVKKYSHAKIILLTIPPMARNVSGDLAGAYDRVDPVVDGIKQLAFMRNLHLVDVNAVINAELDLEEDGIHLNQSGRNKVTDAVWQKLYELEFSMRV
jgi:lysophospholipase L1-like esterase